MTYARVLQTADWHAAGEPLRLLTGGAPRLDGSTMRERLRQMRERHDDLRRLLIAEPRGHRDMYAALLLPPVSAEAAFGVLFMQNEGYSSMCGHGIIAVASHVVAHRIVSVSTPRTAVAFDTPAGLVRAQVETELRGGAARPRAVTMTNVPSFVLQRDLRVPLGTGRVRADLVFGGAFYALVEAREAGVELAPGAAPGLVEAGRAIRRWFDAHVQVQHPEQPDLCGLYGVIFCGPPRAGGDGRNVTVFADGEIDRSPTGTGTSARLALLAADGRIAAGQTYRNESLIDTVFEARLAGETAVGPLPAVVTEVRGSAYPTGFHTFVLDAEDPLAEGFFVG